MRKLLLLTPMLALSLAELCGVSRQTINAIENNKYDPSLPLAFALAHHLRVAVDDLFLYGEEEEK